MEENKPDKRRSPNFSIQEEELLLELINKYVHIIENKGCSAVTNKEKWSTWIQIADEFNASSKYLYRDVKILRMKYENLKKKCKLRLSKGKMRISSTTTNTNSENSNHSLGIEFIGLDDHDDQVQYPDDDGEVQPSTSSTILVQETERALPFRIQKISAGGTRAVINDNLDDMQKKAFWEQHEQKLQHEKEIHELKLEQMKRDADLEHNIKLERWQLEKELLLKKVNVTL